MKKHKLQIINDEHTCARLDSDEERQIRRKDESVCLEEIDTFNYDSISCGSGQDEISCYDICYDRDEGEKT